MISPRALKRKLKALGAIGHRERLLLVEASAWLALARLWLLLRPFRDVARMLGEPRDPGEPALLEPEAVTPGDRATAQDIGMALERAAKHVPFRAVCLQQAIAGKLMLRRRGIPSLLHFGVSAAQSDGGSAIRAHAWLDVTNLPVTGYPIGRDMREIACFA